MLRAQFHQSRGVATGLAVLDTIALDPCPELVCRQRCHRPQLTMRHNHNPVPILFQPKCQRNVRLNIPARPNGEHRKRPRRELAGRRPRLVGDEWHVAESLVRERPDLEHRLLWRGQNVRGVIPLGRSLVKSGVHHRCWLCRDQALGLGYQSRCDTAGGFTRGFKLRRVGEKIRGRALTSSRGRDAERVDLVHDLGSDMFSSSENSPHLSRLPSRIQSAGPDDRGFAGPCHERRHASPELGPLSSRRCIGTGTVWSAEKDSMTSL
jgi:hypothetical protein